MGSQQLFCLRWSNHQTNMLSVFDELLQNEALVDVTIACEGLSMKAHKVVLSACSPYFQSLFLQNPCKHPIVILKDIKYTELKALVDFMYKGEVNVTQEQLNALLKTAETLKIKGLAEVTGGMNGQQSERATPPPLMITPPLQQTPSSSSSSSALQCSGSQQIQNVDRLPPLQLGGSVVAAAEPSLGPTMVQRPSRPLPTTTTMTTTLLHSQHPRSASPPQKRRKTRHRRRSADKAHSDNETSDCVEVHMHGSPEMLITKVEVPSEGFDSGPGRPPEQDGHLDQTSDAPLESAQETSSQCSFRSTPHDSHEDMPIGQPLAALPSLAHLPAIPVKVKSEGPSTSGGGSSQGTSTKKMTSNSKFTSKFWTYFMVSESDDSKAECLLCLPGTLISRGSKLKGTKYYGTSGLKNHLEKKHPNEIRTLRESDGGEKTTRNSTIKQETHQ